MCKVAPSRPAVVIVVVVGRLILCDDILASLRAQLSPARASLFSFGNAEASPSPDKIVSARDDLPVGRERHAVEATMQGVSRRHVARGRRLASARRPPRRGQPDPVRPRGPPVLHGLGRGAVLAGEVRGLDGAVEQFYVEVCVCLPSPFFFLLFSFLCKSRSYSRQR